MTMGCLISRPQRQTPQTRAGAKVADRFGRTMLVALAAVGMIAAVPAVVLAQDPDDDKVHNTPPPDPAEEIKQFRAGWDRIANFGMDLIGGSIGGGLHSFRGGGQAWAFSHQFTPSIIPAFGESPLPGIAAPHVQRIAARRRLSSFRRWRNRHGRRGR